MQGKFFWYDVMTTDTQAAQKFYGDVVGWGAQDSGTPGADYTLFTVNGQGVAGLMPISAAVSRSFRSPRCSRTRPPSAANERFGNESHQACRMRDRQDFLNATAYGW